MHRRLPAVDTMSQLGTRPVSTPIPRQEWAEALSAILAPDANHAVLAPDAHRAVRMGAAVRLVRGPLDANALVHRLDRLLGPGVHLGAVEEHGRRILELVISDEIANLELDNPQVQGIIVAITKGGRDKYGVSNPQGAKGKINILSSPICH